MVRSLRLGNFEGKFRGSEAERHAEQGCPASWEPLNGVLGLDFWIRGLDKGGPVLS